MNTSKNPFERGQALVLLVIGIIGLIGITALAIDGGNAFSDRRHAQNAADTAALAGALASVRGNNITSSAESQASQNNYANGGPNVTVVVSTYNKTEYDTVFKKDVTFTYVRVDITSIVDTYFGKVIGVNQVTNNVYAIARARKPFYTQIAYGNAVVGLSPHECQAVKYQGNADTNVTGGGIWVNSDCEDSAYFNNSSAGKLTVPCLNSVGGITYKTGSLDLTGCTAPETGQTPFDPDIWVAPTPTCSGTAAKLPSDPSMMSPGNYTGTFPPAGVTHLQAGTYCIDGDFRMNANDELHGTEVTFYLKTGGVTWNGGAEVDLHAPTSGPLVGWLIILPTSNNSPLSIAGNNESTFSGTIFAPRSHIDFKGTANPSGVNSQIVGWTVELTGTSSNSINYSDDQNADVNIQPIVELNE